MHGVNHFKEITEVDIRRAMMMRRINQFVVESTYMEDADYCEETPESVIERIRTELSFIWDMQDCQDRKEFRSLNKAAASRLVTYATILYEKLCEEEENELIGKQ